MSASSRRAMLAGISAVPLLAIAGCPTPAPAAVDRTAWEAVVAKHAAAWRALEEHPYMRMALGDPGYAEAEADEARCSTAALATESDLFATPAPDHAAVIEKLRLYLRNYGESDDTRIFASVIDDIERLAPEGR